MQEKFKCAILLVIKATSLNRSQLKRAPLRPRLRLCHQVMRANRRGVQIFSSVYKPSNEQIDFGQQGDCQTNLDFTTAAINSWLASLRPFFSSISTVEPDPKGSHESKPRTTRASFFFFLCIIRTVNLN